jgi:chromosome segregation ATPase
MTEAIGWTGAVMAVLAMVRGEVAAYTARRTAREKAESDRLSARDKLEFDSKLLTLQSQNESLLNDHSTCAETTKRLQADVDRCRDQHAESERDRAETKGRLASLETMFARVLVPTAPK